MNAFKVVFHTLKNIFIFPMALMHGIGFSLQFTKDKNTFGPAVARQMANERAVSIQQAYLSQKWRFGIDGVLCLIFWYFLFKLFQLWLH
jgi:hypothetical protein